MGSFTTFWLDDNGINNEESLFTWHSMPNGRLRLRGGQLTSELSTVILYRPYFFVSKRRKL